MALVQVMAPSAEPIDLAEAKLHLRYAANDQDALILAAIAGVRAQAETLTNKQLVACRWKQVLDSFPGYSTTFAPYGRTFSLPGNAILLRRFPVLQVVSIQYLDMEGATQTVDPSTYTVDYSTEPVRITPVFGEIWPIPLPQIGSVWITFDAGYAARITAQGNNLTVQGWTPLNVGDAVRLSNSGGALPAPLQPMTDYFVQSVVSPGVYTLAAIAGAAAIPLTDAGSGTNFLGVIPEGIKAWMKLRLGTLDVSRDEPTLEPINANSMTFADRLLDGYKIYEF